MTRAELKTQAKAILKANYWKLVGMTVVYYAITMGAAMIIPYFGSIASFFLFPIYMGLMIAIVNISDGTNGDFSTMFNEGFNGKYYLRRVGGTAWMGLWVFLWTLLFWIPGFVKAYSYAMTPYILAKYPEIPAKEALKLSMKVMNGRKAELFVLQLSFFGWMMLTGMTFGLVGIFYVFPYMIITETLYYKDVMKQVTDSGEFSYTTGETN